MAGDAPAVGDRAILVNPVIVPEVRIVLVLSIMSEWPAGQHCGEQQVHRRTAGAWLRGGEQQVHGSVVAMASRGRPGNEQVGESPLGEAPIDDSSEAEIRLELAEGRRKSCYHEDVLACDH